MNFDALEECPRCEGDACYKQEVTKDITLHQCMGCGFMSTTLMKVGSEFYNTQVETLPELYKDLLWEDSKTKQFWMPQTINIPDKGMVFANGTSKDNWRWSAVLAVKIKEKEKHKYPKPGKKKEFYEWRVDMSTQKDYPEKGFIDALEYIGVFSTSK